jgi:RHS repeat-associated protein
MNLGNRVDAMGRRIFERRDFAPTDGYQYDPSDELTSYKRDGTLNGDGTVSASFWNSTGLIYDNNGNRTEMNGGATGTITYAHNTLNQYDSVSSMGSLDYDGKGNLASADGWTYTYDAQNRLTTMQGAGMTISMTYDPLNRVITRNVNGAVSQNVWDAWNLIEEHRPDWSLQRCYLYGANQNEMVASFDGNVYGTHWYWQDGRGNTSHITGDAANLFERYTYDLNGAPRFYDPNGSERMVSAYDTRFLFAGSQYLPDTGLYDMRNRVYHIGLNRFLQTDPIGFKVMRSISIATAGMTMWIGAIRWG